jgi:F-type H+-transporting ATPase subunit b
MLSSIGIQPVSLAGQIVSFLILYWAFRKFLFGPILENLEKRAQRQAKALKAADETIRIKEELEANEKNLKQKLDRQIQEQMAKAQEEAVARREEVVAEARTEAAKAAQKEYVDLEKKIQAREKKARQEIAKLVIAATKKALLEHLDKRVDQKIVARQIKKIPNIKVS